MATRRRTARKTITRTHVLTRARVFTRTHVEQLLWSVGLTHVAGVDEVGMGPLAGPVVAAAVVFASGCVIDGIADSKTMVARAREAAAAVIRERAIGIGIGLVDAQEIDRINIYQAGLKAMGLAIAALPRVPDHVLIDGRRIPELAIPQTRYSKGDVFVFSIAAASIIAKVHRDAMMHQLDSEYPEYGFRHHVGYATRAHLAALKVYGPCPLHRRSFAPCAADGRAAAIPPVDVPHAAGAPSTVP